MEYIVKVWATVEYLLQENSSKDIAKFIAEVEWKKIFVHNVDEDQIWISQYEKTTRFKIPIILVEEKQEEILEEKQEEEILETTNFFQNIDKDYVVYWIMILIVIIFIGIWINNQYTKTNIQEIPKVVIQEKTPWEMLSDRETLINKKIDYELYLQKKMRDDIKKSIEKVKEYDQQKNEIKKQKIEIAQ